MLAQLKTPALVLADPGLDLGPVPDGVTLARLDDPPPADGGWTSVLLAVTDEASLRRAASVLPPLGRARRIACFVAGGAAPATPLLRPEWPELVDLDARTREGGGALTRLTFRRGAPVAPVLVELARRTGDPVTTGNAGLVLALAGTATAPPVDPSVVLGDPDDLERQVPPDVVLGAAPAELPAHPVTGRAPVVVEDPDDIGPLDEALLNPRGFRTGWDRGPVPIPDGEPTPAMVASLRDAQAVVVGPDASPRTVAGLAMAGVPLVGGEFGTPDLDDRLRREEHSIRLRRAALRRHSTLAWRARLARRAGVRVATYPSVSVLLPTRRPEQLDFALRQVARQRDAEIELVLATHGFEADPARVRDVLGDVPHTLVPAPAGTLFGDVLRRATDAAGGDVVVKMDDDDWYGPHVVADLLLARHYSGAELVGMPAEFVYLEPIRTTVRRRGATEITGAVVAGGTMTIDRSLLRAIGGFRPVRRFVDAQLLAAVRAAGGSVYRTQGLGYVLRRTTAGHTWDTELGHFLTRKALADQWRGFRPSRLMEADLEAD